MPSAPSSTAPPDVPENAPSPASSSTPSPSSSSPAPAPQPVRAPTQMYSSCAQARAAGAAPLYEGDPGYNPRLDRDKDGVACE